MIKHASIILVATLLLLGTYQRNKTWKDSLTLWENTVGKAPLKARSAYPMRVCEADRDWPADEIGDPTWVPRFRLMPIQLDGAQLLSHSRPKYPECTRFPSGGLGKRLPPL